MLLFRTIILITTILMGCCSFVVDTKFNNAIGKILYYLLYDVVGGHFVGG